MSWTSRHRAQTLMVADSPDLQNTTVLCIFSPIISTGSSRARTGLCPKNWQKRSVAKWNTLTV